MAPPNFVAEQLYSKAVTHRVAALPDPCPYFYYEVINRVQQKYWIVHAKTADFQNSDDASGTITLIKTDGSEGWSKQVLRNDVDIWAPHPSTLFYPGPAGEKVGFLFVTENFFVKNQLTATDYASGPDKWPPRLESVFLFAEFGRAVARFDPRVTQKVLKTLPKDVARELTKLIKGL